MIKATRVGNTVICFLDNKMYQRDFDNESEILEIYERICNTNEYNADEVQVLKEIMTPPMTSEEKVMHKEYTEKKGEYEANKGLIDFMDRISTSTTNNSNFEVKDNQLFMKNIPVPIPEFLGRKIAEVHNEEHTSFEDLEDQKRALTNFWRLCVLNPNTRCREDLYGFLAKNKMTITPSGCFIAYRNVNVQKEGNQEMNTFVSQQWAQVKTWKKSPKNYGVYKKGSTYKIVKNKEEFKSSQGSDYKDIKIPIDLEGNTVTTKSYGQLDESQDPHHGEVYCGNLHDMYQNLSNTNDKDTTVYTDGWSGSMTITIGEPVSIPRNQCDSNPDATCSRGLHAANSEWLNQGYFGTTGLAILINPMNVVSCPYQDSGKLRCCEYMPVSVINFDEEGNVIPFDCSVLDVNYGKQTETTILDMLNNADFDYSKSQKVVPLDLDFADYYNMVSDYGKSLTEMNKVIKSRVKNV